MRLHPPPPKEKEKKEMEGEILKLSNKYNCKQLAPKKRVKIMYAVLEYV